MANLVKRQRYLDLIRRFYGDGMIKVISGVRRCGKSVLLSQIEDDLLEQGVPSDHFIRINFEDIEFDSIRTCEKLNEYVKSQIHDEGKYYIFLDEIQHVRSFEQVLNSFRATLNCEIFVTGSNSKLLSGRLGTLLVGRCVEIKILPLSFSEAYELHLMNGGSPNPDSFFMDYLMWGGFPQRFVYNDEYAVRHYLEHTYNEIVERDIANDRSNIDRAKFKKIASYIMEYAGKEFSVSSICDYFKNANNEVITKETLYSYLDKMEKACLIDRVPRYDIRGKEKMRYIEKHYACDIGFRRINSNIVHPEEGAFLENIVYNELISRGYQVYVGKTKNGEIDFVVMNGGKHCFIQVAYTVSNKEVFDREFGAYSQVRDYAPKYVLSLDRLDYSFDGIGHINIVDFLLGEKDITLQ